MDEGADVNFAYKSGMGALWVACSGGFADVVEFLLSKGATSSLHLRKYKQGRFSPNLAAAGAGHVNVVDILISSGHNK